MKSAAVTPAGMLRFCVGARFLGCNALNFKDKSASASDSLASRTFGYGKRIDSIGVSVKAEYLDALRGKKNLLANHHVISLRKPA